MKPPMKLLLLSVLLTVSVTLLFCGCNANQKTIAYKSLKATADTVDTAMKAYSDAVVQGKVDLNTQAKVRDLHGKYQVAFRKAVAAARFDYTAPAPEDVSNLAGQIAEAVMAFAR